MIPYPCRTTLTATLPCSPLGCIVTMSNRIVPITVEPDIVKSEPNKQNDEDVLPPFATEESLSLLIEKEYLRYYLNGHNLIHESTTSK